MQKQTKFRLLFVLSFLKYIKYGPFIEELKTTMKPFVGSSNQEFMEVSKNEKTK